MKILGLDVGEKRIGVAKVDTGTRIAIPVDTLKVDGSEWDELLRLCKLNNTNLFVLGLPRSNEGNETAQSVYVRNFAKTLTEKIAGARIKFQDESLTSVIAEERLKSRKKKYEKGEIDAEAACIILQDFVESLKRGSSTSSSEAQSFRNTQPRQDKRTTTNKKPSLSSKEGIEHLQKTVVAATKKESDKIKLNGKKAMSKAKKWTIFGIPIILIVLGLGGATAVLKYRDFVRQQREEENARIEAEMEAKTFRFTIRPGETIYDVKKHLLELDRNGGNADGEMIPNYTAEEIDTAFNASYDFDFLADRPAGATLEGYLYAETFEFFSDATVEDILKNYLKKMSDIVAENELASKYAERGLSLYDGITLASIIQKEAPTSEMPTVAQVFLTRLSYGIPLGSDVTVSYALDTVDPDRQTYVDNQAALTVDSCYNTRLHGGLPCGPISNPGLSALLSVASPSDTSYLYFLTGDDGVMYYSNTEEEHNQNIYLHCQTLCDVSL